MSHGEAAGARIANELRSRIISGVLPPGTRIVQEDIAAEFGVSRLPIREAFRTLQTAGLVKLVASTGAWVSRLTIDEGREVYLMRERLEPLLLGLAVPKHTPETLQDCERAAAAVREATDVGQFLELDRNFHRMLTGPAAEARLKRFVDHLWNLTHYYRRLLLEATGIDRRGDVLAEHSMALRAVRDGDADSAEAMWALHIRHTRKMIEQRPEIFGDGELD